LVFLVPVDAGDFVGDAVGCIVLVAAHDFENTIGIVGDGVEAYELVVHGDGEEVFYDVSPVVAWFIFEVCPVEVVVFVEFTVWAGVGEIDGFFWGHGYEDLNE